MVSWEKRMMGWLMVLVCGKVVFCLSRVWLFLSVSDIFFFYCCFGERDDVGDGYSRVEGVNGVVYSVWR